MSCKASAPCTTVWAWRANRAKNRSSLGRRARNQRNMAMSNVSERPSSDPSQNCHRLILAKGPSCPAARPDHPPLCCGSRKDRRIRSLERDPEEMRDLADQAAAERQHAGDEDNALDDGDPLPEARQ